MIDHRIVFVPAILVMLVLLGILAMSAEASSALAALLFLGGFCLASLGTGLSPTNGRGPSLREQLAYHRANSKYWPLTLAGLLTAAGATAWFYATEAGSTLEQVLMMLVLIAAVMNFWVHPAATKKND